jgi:hypothetical protein
MVVDEPPPAQLDPFKIPMKIVEHVMNNYYSGDGTVHPGDHLLFIHELCKLFKCAAILCVSNISIIFDAPCLF